MEKQKREELLVSVKPTVMCMCGEGFLDLAGVDEKGFKYLKCSKCSLEHVFSGQEKRAKA